MDGVPPLEVLILQLDDSENLVKTYENERGVL